jgi:DnaJ-related protein SCJ1
MQTVIEIPLAQVYNGGNIQIEVEKNVICEDCSGTGAEDPKYVVGCDQCSGRGIKIVKQMLAPGIFQQMQGMCDRCGGTGKIITKPCKTCQGQKVHRERVQHDFEIPKGLPLNAQIIIEQEADENPDWEPGDLVLTVREINNAAVNGGFRRRGPDLFIDVPIGVYEALGGGFERRVTHLDGRNITLRRNKGKIVQSGRSPRSDSLTLLGHVETLANEGMPIFRSEDFGNLHVTYKVIFPAVVDDQFIKDIELAFEGRKKRLSASGAKKDEL